MRPLYDDAAENASAVTRDYVLELDADGPKVLSVFGGKITTYRRLAEHALEKLDLPGLKPPWTGNTPLPGGDMPESDFEAFQAGLRATYPFLPDALARRLARAYGTRPSVSWAMRATCPTSGRASTAVSPPARSIIWCAWNGRARPTTFCGDARSSG